jgi:hypothetical protein
VARKAKGGGWELWTVNQKGLKPEEVAFFRLSGGLFNGFRLFDALSP